MFLFLLSALQERGCAYRWLSCRIGVACQALGDASVVKLHFISHLSLDSLLRYGRY